MAAEESPRLRALKENAKALEQSIADRKKRDLATVADKDGFKAVTAAEERELKALQEIIAAETPNNSAGGSK